MTKTLEAPRNENVASPHSTSAEVGRAVSAYRLELSKNGANHSYSEKAVEGQCTALETRQRVFKDRNAHGVSGGALKSVPIAFPSVSRLKRSKKSPEEHIGSATTSYREQRTRAQQYDFKHKSSTTASPKRNTATVLLETHGIGPEDETKSTRAFSRVRQVCSSTSVPSRRTRDSPLKIIYAIRHGRYSAKNRAFNLAAWSKVDSDIARFICYLLSKTDSEISAIKSFAENAHRERPSSIRLFEDQYRARLNREHYSEDDFYEWFCAVLSPPSHRADIYICSTCAAPPAAILLDILKGAIPVDASALRRLVMLCKMHVVQSQKTRYFTDDHFIRLYSMLMDNSRRINPQFLSKEVVPLISQYCMQISGEEENTSDLSSRLSWICNDALEKLAIMADSHPFESMQFAWDSQAMVLELVNVLSAPVTLEASSYRALAKVLVACKKAEWEEHAITHILPSWPPWRKTQDGMDARIRPDDELSRAVSVVRNLVRAGHSLKGVDQAALILGGRDVDGTPTIASRSILKTDDFIFGTCSGANDRLWAARIRATRNIKEAWSAFRACREAGQKPTIGMYDEMLEKLVFDKKRQGGSRNSPRVPGAGKEVAAYGNDNLTETELQRVSPPSIEELTDAMKRDGLELSRRSLDLLVESARTPDHALKLLSSRGLPKEAVRKLAKLSKRSTADWKSPVSHIRIGHSIPYATLLAYIKLLCRFSAYRKIHRRVNDGRSVGLEFILGAVNILQQHPNLRDGYTVVVKAISLIKITQKADRKYDFRNAGWLWALNIDLLQHLRHTLHAINADHFGYACYGLFNAIAAEAHGFVMPGDGKRDGLAFMKDLWRFLTGHAEDPVSDDSKVPMLYAIKGWQLHAYVRLLALADEREEIVHVISFMSKYSSELDEVGRAGTNGIRLLRRTLLAMRLYAISTRDEQYESTLGEIAKSIDEEWGGWPTDFEVDEYLNRRTEAERSRDITEDVRLGHEIIKKGAEGMFSSAEDGLM